MQASIRTALVCLFSFTLHAGEWLTFSGDSQRSGWAKDESKISASSVKNMKLLWSVKLDNEPRELNALTVPVVIINLPTPGGFRDIAIVAGSSDTVFGLDADNGKILWKTKIDAQGTPKSPPDWLCPNALNRNDPRPPGS